ncbi:MAG TPA: hypothetical protein VHC86_03830 [Opitutaceae bacterium]|nr:hypothetical protein [Opitutaceae bacterium]
MKYRIPSYVLASAFIAVLTPIVASGAASTDVRFGAMTHFAQGQNPAWAATVSSLGIATVRDELYWDSVETSRGVYSFTGEFDNYMAKLKSGNIAPYIVLDWGNKNYDTDYSPFDADGLTGYTNYSNQVLSHYGSQVSAVEIWNEYNGTWCSGPATNNRPQYYTAMLKAAYAGIKAARPDVVVSGGSTAGIALGYWEQLMQNGALGAMDVESIHPYRYNQAPEGIEDDVIALQNLTKRYNNGQAKPIWVSEIGWVIQSGNNTTLNIDATTQAKFLARAYPLLLSAGAQRVYWYDYSDDVGISTMGLTDSSNTPRASGLAFKAMSQELSGANFVRREASLPGLYSELFQRADGTQVRVMWSLDNASFAASGATKIVDMTGNPVAVTGTLKLSDAPVYVEGPLSGLPAATETPLADAETDFGNAQGNNGWSYGYASGSGSTNFVPFTGYAAGQWNGPASYLLMTACDQQPSGSGSTPLLAIRRWTSTFAGNVHISGSFVAENAGYGGDGVGVTVRVNGQPITTRALIGTNSTPFESDFDVVQTVQVGTTIDFVVDPGPAADNSYDACGVYAKISTSAQSGTFLPGSGVNSTGTGSGGGSTSLGGSASTGSGSAASSGPSSNAADGTVLADANGDFSGAQGQAGWSYGDFASGTNFQNLTAFSGVAWSASYPYISITSGDQHPSTVNGGPVSVVRRWTSSYAGAVSINGQFVAENTGGDGVGVTVLLNGQPLLARAAIGAAGAPTQKGFSLNATLKVGDTLDFAVDPGPAADINFDATGLSATVTASSSSSGSGSSAGTGTSTAGSGLGAVLGSSGSSDSSGSAASAANDTNTASGVQVDATGDYSATAPARGWSYGYFVGGAGAIGSWGNASFSALGSSGGGWTGPVPSLAVGSSTLSPSAVGIVQYAAVKRWTSNYTGNVQVSGSFTDTRNGDGVGVCICVNGQAALARSLIGVTGDGLTRTFSFVQAVIPGTTIDFVVDPGPGRDYAGDATVLNATIASCASAPTTGISVSAAVTGTANGTSGDSASGSSSSSGASGPAGAGSSGSTATSVAANAASDFSLTQGQGGWIYGYFVGPLGAIGPAANATLTTMSSSGSSWSGPFPSLGITATTLSPSAAGIVQYSAVKRWTSTYTGNVQVSGSFNIGHDGDGVGVTVMVNGRPQSPRAVIGNSGSSRTHSFSFVQAVVPGTTIDFVVDPGPGRDYAHDATTLTVGIASSF